MKFQSNIDNESYELIHKDGTIHWYLFNEEGECMALTEKDMFEMFKDYFNNKF
jgi:hypothetical protein